MIHLLPRRITALALVAAATTFGAAAAQAQSVENDNVPISFTDTNCNGENVDFAGYVHTVITQTADSAGGSHFTVHINFNNVSGVGDQGNLYRLAGSSEGAQNQVAANEFTVEENVAFVAQGSAPNGRVKALVHVTQNANGTVTATVDNASVSCQG